MFEEGGYEKYKQLYQSFKLFKERMISSSQFDDFLKQGYWKYKLPKTEVSPITSAKQYHDLLHRDNIIFLFEHIEYMDKEALNLKQEYYQTYTSGLYPSLEIIMLESKGYSDYNKEFNRNHLFMVVDGLMIKETPNEPVFTFEEAESSNNDKSVEFRINGDFSGILLRYDGYDHVYLDLN